MGFTDPNVKRLLAAQGQSLPALPRPASPQAKGRTGSRQKLSERFTEDVLKHWEEHGEAALNKMRFDKPAEYVKMVAGLIPKDLNLDASADIKQFMEFVAAGGKLKVDETTGQKYLEIEGSAVEIAAEPQAEGPRPLSQADRTRRELMS